MKKCMKLPYPILRGKLSQIRYPCAVERKYDGNLIHLLLDIDEAGNGTVKFITKAGEEHTIEVKGEQVHQMIGRKAHILAESVVEDGIAGSLVRLPTDLQKAAVRVFDIVSCEAVDVSAMTYSQRREYLEKLGDEGELAHQVICNTVEEVHEQFRLATQAGYEGIVVKNLDSKLILGPCGWVKIKFKDQSDYYVTSIDPVRERIEVEVVSVDKLVASTQQCGVKVINSIKKTLKVGDLVTIEHQGITSGGSLRHPVFVGKA